MKIGLGIDTGGTYTDAVLFAMEEKTILCAAKARTTHRELSIGIGEALDKMDSALLQQVEYVSLSTTLATNACVENKGGRAHLLLLNVPKKTLDWVGKDYGLQDDGSVLCAGEGGTLDGTRISEPDWDALCRENAAFFGEAQGLAVVELYAMNNGAVVEKHAKEHIENAFDVPVVCGHELFHDLNSMKRGAGTLLNARLVPILTDFLAAIDRAFQARGIHAETVVMRSDATVMGSSFAKERPVETILCGPACSVLGGMALSGEENCVIVDMGGTTTDISLVKNGKAVTAHDGVTVGGWKTYVKGVYIDTFALGGDSAVRLTDTGMTLCPQRVVPLCVAAMDYPEIKDKLRVMLLHGENHTKPLHEFFVAVKNIQGDGRYTQQEQDFVGMLSGRALSYGEAARAMGMSPTSLKTERLEAEGVILRCGFTPTDAMHVKGDFTTYDGEASRIAAAYFAKMRYGDAASEGDAARVCDAVYEMVERTLYENIVRVLLTDKFPKLFEKGADKQLSALIQNAWEHPEAGFFTVPFTTTASLVGIGAPIHIFLEKVAKVLGTKCVIPEHAEVANAVGAVTGRISAQARVKVVPDYRTDGENGYIVQGSQNRLFETLEEALTFAKEDAMRLATEEARRRGITGAIQTAIRVEKSEGHTKDGAAFDLGTTVICETT